MIETDEVGQEQIESLIKSLNIDDWNEWEMQFIEGLDDKKYSSLSSRQKAILTRLYEKIT